MARASRCGLLMTSRNSPPWNRWSAAILFSTYKCDSRRNQNKTHHQRSQRFVYAAEQTVKRQTQTDENDRPNQVRKDAQTKEHFVSLDVGGRRRRVARYDQLAGHIDQAERPHQLHG